MGCAFSLTEANCREEFELWLEWACPPALKRVLVSQGDIDTIARETNMVPRELQYLDYACREYKVKFTYLLCFAAVHAALIVHAAGDSIGVGAAHAQPLPGFGSQALWRQAESLPGNARHAAEVCGQHGGNVLYWRP